MWQTTQITSEITIQMNLEYSKTCLKWPLKKKTKIGFQTQLSLNAGQKYCRMLQGEHSAILSTFIKLPFVIKTFVLSIFEWPLKTGFTVPLQILQSLPSDREYQPDGTEHLNIASVRYLLVSGSPIDQRVDKSSG